MLRRLSVLLACGQIFLAVPALAETADEPFSRIMASLKSGDTQVDYSALRIAYVQSAYHDPYGFKNINVNSGWQNADCGTAVSFLGSDQGQIVLYRNLQIEAHMAMAYCLAKQGDTAKAEPYRQIVDGLLKSIFASGDGKSPKTAFKVVSLVEEKAVLAILGLRKQMQSLMGDDGHSIDVINASSIKSPDTRTTVYFNVDLLGKKSPY